MRRISKRTTKKTAKAKPAPKVGDRIIAGLTELRDTMRAGVPLNEKFTVRTVEIAEPQDFGPARVRALRQGLRVSQGVFARLLSVSKVLVQSWEQGTRQPSALARRLLLEIERDPSHWQAMIVTSPVAKAHHRRMSA